MRPLVLTAVLLAACTSDAVRPAASPTRLLSRTEYRNTIVELFGVAPPDASELPEDASLSTTAEVSVKYVVAASRVGARLALRLPSFFPCSSTLDDDCVHAFLRGFGTRIFRRPLTDAEVEHFVALFRSALSSGETPAVSATLMLEEMLSSPQFLLLPVAAPAAPEPVKLAVAAGF